MERRSWLWRKKSSEKSSGETESTGSASSPSLSERCSDEQEVQRGSPNHQSPDITSNIESKLPETLSKSNSEENKDETVKILSEKLSATILDLNVKDDIVKQHAKVAEEAVLGWERAEEEIVGLKAQLDSANQRNSELDDRIRHLDGALKECVRELRQARSDQERKLEEALSQQSCKWESDKSDLELQVTELRAMLEAQADNASPRNTTSTNQESNSKIVSLEKEISSLKLELHSRTLEKEFSIKAAEKASKQRLESLKKVAKLEHECRKLRAKSHKPHSPLQRVASRNSTYTESIADSQSDNETSCSDSWASALLTELDQFKINEKVGVMRSINTSMDASLLDDFSEMERMVASDEFRNKGEEMDKVGIENAFNEVKRQLEDTKVKLKAMEQKSIELQKNLNSMNGEKCTLEMELESLEVKKGEVELHLERAKLELKDLKAERNEMESQLKSTRGENSKFREKVKILQREIDHEKALSKEMKAKLPKIELMEVEKRKLESQLLMLRKEVATWREKTRLLDETLEKERGLSEELKLKLQEMEAAQLEKRDLQFQFLSSKEEVGVLRENVSSLQKRSTENEAKLQGEVQLLEETLEKERELYKELLTKYKSMEIEEKKRNKLMEKVASLEKKIEEEKKVSLVYAEGLEASETKRNKLATQYEITCREIEELRVKLGTLEKEVTNERGVAIELTVKCKKLEKELDGIKEEGRVKEPTDSKFKVNQEKERVLAAGKLAECQKTIDSISQQLKSLSNLDDFGLEIETAGIVKDEIDKDTNLSLHSAYSEKLAV
ncbi:Filament-like plant protein 3 [Carex littledalei]|uniref:Filament-like plant protein 3 n=1 Tax=Carex littledalei TaxID=544730 RepID=A0A833QYJ2_9POAL|nr:Filament-like plant protein 3 [Carex littledalei]